MNTLIFTLYSSSTFSQNIVKQVPCKPGSIEIRSFPDDESYIKINSDVKNQRVIFIATLDRPNDKLVPLIFAAETARALGASEIGLIAPYLAYMRQDKQFEEGEGITSKFCGKMLSNYFNWILTIDPHLHRYHSLNEIYSIPSHVLHATIQISNWIMSNIPDCLIIGPDQESAQWVTEIAKMVQAPFVILEKRRKGDKEVEISMPSIDKYKNLTPVVLDDIVSTAKTMIETVKLLKNLKMKSPICIAVHAVFAEDAYSELMNSGVAKIATCNTIEHPSNMIDVGEAVARYFSATMNN
ncbi:MAG: ribose-phosphate pyrophosphokinase [Proteobacteria bacterium]|nr:ribose-phosphate pyrophosphokinase [Pseudomonadota bacterium]